MTTNENKVGALQRWDNVVEDGDLMSARPVADGRFYLAEDVDAAMASLAAAPARCDQRFAIVRERPYDGAPAELAYHDGVNFMFADGDCFERDGDTLDGYTAEFLTLHQLEQRLFAGPAPHNGDATIAASVLAAGYEGGFLATSPDDQGVTLQLRYTSPPAAEVAFEELARGIDAALAAGGARTVDAMVDTPAPGAELLPCPFCGGQAQDDFVKGESYLIECYECRAQAGARDGEAEAAAAWNRRASPATIGDGLTERKTAEIMARGYRQVGYVLQNGAGEYCLSTRGGVRWLGAEQHRKLMGGSNEVVLAQLDELLAARERIAELEAKTAPPGWRYVPAMPSPEMMQAAWTRGNELAGTPEGDDPLPRHQYLAMLVAAPAPPTCWCRTCAREVGEMPGTRMVLCPTCGNKRCPHANDHRNACTGSNETGQPGGAYP